MHCYTSIPRISDAALALVSQKAIGVVIEFFYQMPVNLNTLLEPEIVMLTTLFQKKQNISV